MYIKSLWITRKGFARSEPPEMLVGWDEYSVEENSEGFIADCERALESVGNDVEEFRYLNIYVPTEKLWAAFDPKSIEGEVDAG